MMPVVAGHQSTRRQILIYAVLLLPIAMAPFLLQLTGWIYGLSALLLGGAFLFLSIKVATFRTAANDTDMRAEKRLFAFSIIYLFVLFGALVADRLILGVHA